MVGCDLAPVLAAGGGSLIPYLVKEVTRPRGFMCQYSVFIRHEKLHIYLPIGMMLIMSNLPYLTHRELATLLSPAS